LHTAGSVANKIKFYVGLKKKWQSKKVKEQRFCQLSFWLWAFVSRIFINHKIN